jgi:SAM-dependent methyltransferase
VRGVPRAQRFRSVASRRRTRSIASSGVTIAGLSEPAHTKGPYSSWWRRAARKTIVLPAAKRKFAEIRAQIDAFRHGPLVDGIPTPPPTLIQLVAGTSDLDHFLSLGRAGADTVTAAFDRTAIRAGRTLDFGCGCGRVARHLKSFDLYGCDYTSPLVRWCRRHLPGHYEVNRLHPPLPYSEGFFDTCYAFSVFTHLKIQTQEAWRDELARVIRPGGHLLASFHGDAYLDGRILESELPVYRAGAIVVRRGDLEGTNTCASFHPPDAVEGLFTPLFTVIEFVAKGARGNPDQDLYVLRRR